MSQCIRSTFVSLLLFITLLPAQLPAKDFGDFVTLRWGASKTEVREFMSQRGAAEDEQEGSNLIFSDGIFFREVVRKWTFDFSKGELGAAGVLFLCKEQDAAITRFKKLRESLTEKYGEPRLSEGPEDRLGFGAYGGKAKWNDGGREIYLSMRGACVELQYSRQ